jgi:hypothetical protein
MPSTVPDISGALNFRGTNGTTIRRHLSLASSDPDARILPCFRALLLDKDKGSRTGGWAPGRNDVATLTQDGDGFVREEVTVRWSQHDGGTNWMALADFVERDGGFTPSPEADVSRQDYRGRSRISKFPSGELPDESSEFLEFGSSTIDSRPVTTAYLDELHVWRHERFITLGWVANSEHLTEETDTIGLRPVPPATTLSGVPGYRKECGLIDYDGELIAYRDSHFEDEDLLVLEGCVRGVLGTKARTHATAGYARFVPNVPLAYLSGDLPKDGASVPMSKMHKDDWPRVGLVRIVGEDTVELVHYVGRGEEELIVPEALEADTATRGRGLLRGRFGTETLAHESGEMVFWQPFRVWDRFMPREQGDKSGFRGVHDHPEACYLELAKTVAGAYWRQARWVQNLDGRSDDVASSKDAERKRSTDLRKIVVLARFDPTVPWGSREIVDLRGGRRSAARADRRPEKKIYVLDDPEGLNSFEFEADTAEFRVFFQFLPGAFAAMDVGDAARNPDDREMVNVWKLTPWLRSFTAEFDNGTRTLYKARIR